MNFQKKFVQCVKNELEGLKYICCIFDKCILYDICEENTIILFLNIKINSYLQLVKHLILLVK